MGKLVRVNEIKTLIIELRGEKVILDADLAKIYGVSTKRLNEQVGRNLDRFPEDFMFQLTEEEKEKVVAICDHLKKLKYSYQAPRAFTRNGANMISAVLKSKVAVRRSIQIMRAFSALEEIIAKKNKIIVSSPAVLTRLSNHSRAIMHLFQKDRINAKEITAVKSIINEMIGLLQKMVFKSGWNDVK
jgi:hypothetical protein